VDRVCHIDRGYENIEKKPGVLGARICRLPNWATPPQTAAP